MTGAKMVYFVQRPCRWQGFWRPVPLQDSIDGLHSRLVLRGYILKEVYPL